MKKIDLKKEMRSLYAPSSLDFSVVDVPAYRYLMVDGKGDPNSSKEYSEAVEALFSVSYAAKFIVKKQGEIDFSVMPLEGLWWADVMEDFRKGRKELWCWTMMTMQPEVVSERIVHDAFESIRKKKNLPAIDRIRYDVLHEGQSAQILYRGPYNEETETIARLHGFIAQRGNSLAGKHHEIYLNDPRRTAPEKLKTIIRQPFL